MGGWSDISWVDSSGGIRPDRSMFLIGALGSAFHFSVEGATGGDRCPCTAEVVAMQGAESAFERYGSANE